MKTTTSIVLLLLGVNAQAADNSATADILQAVAEVRSARARIEDEVRRTKLTYSPHSSEYGVARNAYGRAAEAHNRVVDEIARLAQHPAAAKGQVASGIARFNEALAGGLGSPGAGAGSSPDNARLSDAGGPVSAQTRSFVGAALLHLLLAVCDLGHSRSRAVGQVSQTLDTLRWAAWENIQ